MTRVILFKAPGSSDEPDPYRLRFESASYRLGYVPVLQEFFDTAELSGLLSESDNWAGVIITSKRGAEGWIKAVQSIEDVGITGQ